MVVSKVLYVFFVCLLAFCGISKAQTSDSPQTLQKDNSELFLSLKRTACFDGCQVYNLDIQSDGKVIFEGIQLTKVQGKVTGNLSKKKMNQLKAEINQSGFFTLKESYTRNSGGCPNVVGHNPSVILSVKLNGKEKTVTHYLGCREEFVKLGTPWKVFPQPLYNLENKIDEIVGSKRWVGELK